MDPVLQINSEVKERDEANSLWVGWKRKRRSDTTKMYKHINLTPQQALPISRSTFSTVSHRFWPPEGTCPFLPVMSQRQKSKESQGTHFRKCPERASQHPFSCKSKLSRCRQLYQDLKSHFSGGYYENWSIGVWVPGGRTWLWKRHKWTMQQRGKKAS